MIKISQVFATASHHLRGGVAATLLATTSLVALGGAASAQNFSFNSVAVEGNQRIETATILTYLGFERGPNRHCR